MNIDRWFLFSKKKKKHREFFFLDSLKIGAPIRNPQVDSPKNILECFFFTFFFSFFF